jgi:protein-S-isoprenylcysteine O-methyltransferase Ste14
MVMRGALSILGVLLVLVGALFIGQGTNVIHGSSMSGHGGYAGLGAVLVVIGLGLLIWPRRRRSDRTT